MKNLNHKILIAILAVFLLPLRSTAAQGEAVTTTYPLYELLETKPSDTYVMEGHYGRVKFDIPFPNHWDILPGAILNLHLVTNAGAISAVPSVEMRVLVNRYLVFQTILTSPGEYVLPIDLQGYLGEGEGLTDRIEIIMTADIDCEDDDIHSTTIFSDSELTLNYTYFASSYDLADYPSPLYEEAFIEQTVNVVLPSNPSELEMEGAMALLVKLGEVSEGKLIINHLDEFSFQNQEALRENLIIVGRPDNNAFLNFVVQNADTPADLFPRRLSIAISGPVKADPNTRLEYQVNVTNTEAAFIPNLFAEIRLPQNASFANVICTPECELNGEVARWNLGGLQPSDSRDLEISFDLEPTAVDGSIDVTADLLLENSTINIISIETSIIEGTDLEVANLSQSSSQFFANKNKGVSETDGVIQLLKNPWAEDKTILLVTGTSEIGIFKAGRALGTEAYFPTFGKQLALIQNILPSEDNSYQFDSSITFNDLGYSDRVFEGIGQQSTVYQFHIPSNFLLSPEASIDLYFSHSAILEPNSSSINLWFNSTPFASEALDESNKENGHIKAFLPVDKMKPGRTNTIVVEVNSNLLVPCSVQLIPDQAWVTISDQSGLSLPVLDAPEVNLYDLDYLPAPFNLDPDLENVLISLPEAPSEFEISTAIKLAIYLGDKTEGDNYQVKVLMGEPTEDLMMENYQVVVIGRFTRNPVLQTLNEALPQPFIPQTDKIQQEIERVIFRLPDNLDLGYLQMVPSPWNNENVVLIITGTSDVGIGWAIDAMQDELKHNLLEGNLVLTPNEIDVFSLDTRRLFDQGQVSVMSTAIPELAIEENSSAVGDSAPTVENETMNVFEATEDPKANLIVAVSSIIGVVLIGLIIWIVRKQSTN
jgi:hypothetical protein